MNSLAVHPLGREALDDSRAAADLIRATLDDIARANALFGGSAAVAYGIEQLVAGHPDATRRSLTVLDLGAGGGDVARFVRPRLARRGIALEFTALERHPAAARLCRERGIRSLVADVAAIPLANGAADIVIMSQLLHHFRPDAAAELLRAAARLARLGVVVADLRRARAAQVGIWLASFALGFHPVSRHDGVVSVRRGFTTRELSDLFAAAGLRASVRRRPGYRVVGVWTTTHAHG